jgi:hypothetical protein
MIAFALAGPIPGSATNSSCVALLRSTSAAQSGAARARSDSNVVTLANPRNVGLMHLSPFMKRQGLIPHPPLKHAACRVSAMPSAEHFHLPSAEA